MYLLIEWGCKQSGKRPPCRLAFSTGTTLQTYDAGQWHDSTKKLHEVVVHARWEREPTPQQIRRAKLALAPVPRP